jgi:hypothetical protein
VILVIEAAKNPRPHVNVIHLRRQFFQFSGVPSVRSPWGMSLELNAWVRPVSDNTVYRELGLSAGGASRKSP